MDIEWTSGSLLGTVEFQRFNFYSIDEIIIGSLYLIVYIIIKI